MIGNAVVPSASAGMSTSLAVLREASIAVRGVALGARDGALRGVDDAALIDMLAELRRLRAVVGAVESLVQVAFDASQREAAVARGVPRRDAGKGVAEQVALARGVSSYRAANDLALARGLVMGLPATFAKLIDGAVSEHAAVSVARETVCLMPEDRAVVDERVAQRLDGASPRRAASAARVEAARVDAESVVRRIRRAEQDRCVTVRPAPDAMVYLSALVPVKCGVAAYAALLACADAAKAAGDERSRGAIMADTLVARLTGVEDPDQIPVEIQLVMPASTLLAGSGSGPDATAGSGSGSIGTAGSARAVGPRGSAGAAQDFGAAAGTDPSDQGPGAVCGWIGEHPIPAQIAREIALIDDDAAQRWVRRLFTDPISGDVTAADKRRRLFSGSMRRAILARDRVCRCCGSPIRQIDHITAYADGGPTTMRNGQGLCQRCNLAKSLPGWSARSMVIEGRHVTVTETPTGHRYVSEPPPPYIDPPRERVPLDERFEAWMQRALAPRDSTRDERRPHLLPSSIDITFPRPVRETDAA